MTPLVGASMTPLVGASVTPLVGASVAAMAVLLLWPHGPRRSRDAGRLLSGTRRAAGQPAGQPVGQPVGQPAGREVLTTDDVASAMVLLALALQSGCGVVEAIEEVARALSGPPARDLGTVAAALRWGVDERSAWGAVHPAWGRCGAALRLATRAGVPPASLLLSGAADLRAGDIARLEVEAARVAVSMVLPLGLAFLPAFCLTTVLPVVLALARQVLQG